MKQKKNTVVVVICILISVFGFANVNVMADSGHVLTVTRYQQEKSNWCWAACAKMAGKYYSGTPVSQTSIVVYVKGANVNGPADLSESTSAATYASSGYKTFTGSLIVPSFSTVQSRINANRLMIATCGHYVGLTRDYGHEFVIYGWNISGGVNYLLVLDPANSVSYMAKMPSYSEFVYSSSNWEFKWEAVITANS